MRRFPSRCLQFTAVLGLAASLAGCGSGSASSPGTLPPPAPAGAGDMLKATGGWTGRVLGLFACTTTGDTTVVTQTSNGTMVVRAVGGKVAEGAYLGEGQDFGGPIATPGQGGTVTVNGSSATLTDVQIPSRTGGAPMVLNGTVTCR